MRISAGDGFILQHIRQEQEVTKAVLRHFAFRYASISRNSSAALFSRSSSRRNAPPSVCSSRAGRRSSTVTHFPARILRCEALRSGSRQAADVAVADNMRVFIAGAGAGKTTKMADLITDYKIPNGKIVFCIAFTNAAADNIRKKLVKNSEKFQIA